MKRRIIIASISIGFALAIAAAVKIGISWSAAVPAALTGAATGFPDGGTGDAPIGRITARALGKLESASEEIGVSSDITSRITRIFVDEGDRVEAGQELARLDDTVQRARVEAAEAAVRAAQARKARLDAGARIEYILADAT